MPPRFAILSMELEERAKCSQDLRLDNAAGSILVIGGIMKYSLTWRDGEVRPHNRHCMEVRMFVEVFIQYLLGILRFQLIGITYITGLKHLTDERNGGHQRDSQARGEQKIVPKTISTKLTIRINKDNNHNEIVLASASQTMFHLLF